MEHIVTTVELLKDKLLFPITFALDDKPIGFKYLSGLALNIPLSLVSKIGLINSIIDEYDFISTFVYDGFIYRYTITTNKDTIHCDEIAATYGGSGTAKSAHFELPTMIYDAHRIIQPSAYKNAHKDKLKPEDYIHLPVDEPELKALGIEVPILLYDGFSEDDDSTIVFKLLCEYIEHEKAKGHKIYGICTNTTSCGLSAVVAANATRHDFYISEFNIDEIAHRIYGIMVPVDSLCGKLLHFKLMHKVDIGNIIPIYTRNIEFPGDYITSLSFALDGDFDI